MDHQLLGRAGTVERASQQEQQLLKDTQTTLVEKLEEAGKTYPNYLSSHPPNSSSHWLNPIESQQGKVEKSAIHRGLFPRIQNRA